MKRQLLQRNVFLLVSSLSILCIKISYAENSLSNKQMLDQAVDVLTKDAPARLAPILGKCSKDIFSILTQEIKDNKIKTEAEIHSKRLKLKIGCVLKSASAAETKLPILLERLSETSDPQIQFLLSALKAVREGKPNEKIKALLLGIDTLPVKKQKKVLTKEQQEAMEKKQEAIEKEQQETLKKIFATPLHEIYEKIWATWFEKLPKEKKALFENALHWFDQTLRIESKKEIKEPSLLDSYALLAEYIYLVRLVYDTNLYIQQKTQSEACLKTSLFIPSSCKKTCQIIDSKNGFDYLCLDSTQWISFWLDHVDESIFTKCSSYAAKNMLLQPVISVQSREESLKKKEESQNLALQQKVKNANQIFLTKTVHYFSTATGAKKILSWAALLEQLRVGYYLLGDSFRSISMSIPTVCSEYKDIIESTSLMLQLDQQEKSQNPKDPKYLLQLHQSAKKVLQKIDEITKIQNNSGRGTNGNSKIKRIRAEMTQLFLQQPFLIGNYPQKNRIDEFIKPFEEIFFGSLATNPPRLLTDFAKYEDIAHLNEVMDQAIKEVQTQFHDQMAELCEGKKHYNLASLIQNPILVRTVESKLPTLIPLYECLNDQFMQIEQSKRILDKMQIFGCPVRVPCMLGEMGLVAIKSYMAYKPMVNLFNPADVRTIEQKQQDSKTRLEHGQAILNLSIEGILTEAVIEFPMLEKVTRFMVR